MSKPPPPPPPLSSKKMPAIRAGIFVEGPYGPITSPSTNSCANLRGVVLKGHPAKGQWLMQWLSLGKVAAVPTGRIKVISGDNTINPIHIDKFLQVLDKNFIGNQADLQKYVHSQGKNYLYFKEKIHFCYQARYPIANQGRQVHFLSP